MGGTRRNERARAKARNFGPIARAADEADRLVRAASIHSCPLWPTFRLACATIGDEKWIGRRRRASQRNMQPTRSQSLNRARAAQLALAGFLGATATAMVGHLPICIALALMAVASAFFGLGLQTRRVARAAFWFDVLVGVPAAVTTLLCVKAAIDVRIIDGWAFLGFVAVLVATLFMAVAAGCALTAAKHIHRATRRL